MRSWAFVIMITVLVNRGLLAQVTAQDPTTSAVPSASAAASASSSTAPPTAAASTPKNLWSFLIPSASQKQACQEKLCQHALFQMLGQMLAPMHALTGGLIGGKCSGPSAAALAQPATSAEGAAARIQQQEAGAAARRAAIRYLATANCQYYPEAEAALIASLRSDPVECVRIEAARAFVTGCCCTKKTIAALTLAVNGGTKDGFPSERSECVKALAYLALKRCLATYKELQEPVPPEQPSASNEKESAPKSATHSKQVGPTPYYDWAGTTAPLGTLLVEGQHAIAAGLNISRQSYRQITGRQDLTAVVIDALQLPTGQEMPSNSSGITPGIVPAVAEASSEHPSRRLATTGSQGRRVRSLLDLWRSSGKNQDNSGEVRPISR